MVKVSLAGLVALVLVFVGTLLSIWIGLHAVSTSQHRWCSTLELLTKHPVSKPSDPKANPSRENAYIFYSNLKILERQFGC